MTDEQSAGGNNRANLKPYETVEQKVVPAVLRNVNRKSSASLQDGHMLPKVFEPIAKEFYGRPLVEIDPFIYEETFCVISKHFNKNYIHRFNATKSLFLFRPWSPVRKCCIFLSTNQYFDYFVMATILINCVFLAMTDTIEEAEYGFLAIYTVEMIIKIISKGFILKRYTYLRNPWNWLDFVVILSGYVSTGATVGNLAGLRTFRVLRALKTVSIMPGLKTIINALLHSFRQLAEVMTLTIFCLMVFALFALQVYKGELRNKCVRSYMFAADVNWTSWIIDEGNWLFNDNSEPVICGNATGARSCPVNYTCYRIGSNPNYGYTNFDNFPWSMLTTFQLITLDYWENIYNMIVSACGPMSIIFFVIVVFFGSFYLLNLMLAVVALSYEEEAEITLEQRKKDLNEHRTDSTFSFEPGPNSTIVVRKLTKQIHKEKLVLDAKRGLLYAGYKKKTRRKKKSNSGGTPASSKSNLTSPKSSNKQQLKQQRKQLSKSPELAKVQRNLMPSNVLVPDKDGNCLKSRQASSYDSGVVDDHDDIVDDQQNNKSIKNNSEYISQLVILDEIPDRNCSCCAKCCINYISWLEIQNTLHKIVHDPLFELFITVCIVLNTLFLALEHHGMSSSLNRTLNGGNKVFTTIFTVECILKLIALNKDFFGCGWNVFDLLIMTASILDLIFELVDGLSVLRGLRLLRVLKLAQSWVTMKVLLSIIVSSIGALGNLTFVLIIVIYIFAVIGMQLFSKEYTADKFYPDPVPRWNFNDFFHSFMMIFRILCGEWMEPLWDCMRVQGDNGFGVCFAIFLPALVMGNFMVLNLFLALLLNSFNSDELKTRKEEVGDESRLAKSFDRIRSIVRKGKLRRNRFENVVRELMEKNSKKFSNNLSRDNLYNRSYHEAMNRPLSLISCDEKIVNNLPKYEELYRNKLFKEQELETKFIEDLNSNQRRLTFRKMSSGFETQQTTINDEDKELDDIAEVVDCSEAEMEEGKVQPWHTLISFVDDITVGKRKNSKGEYVKDAISFPGFAKKKEKKTPQDCFPRNCYEKCQFWSFLIDTNMGRRFIKFRTFVLTIVDASLFEWLVLVLIFASSITLCFEDIYLDSNLRLKQFLYWTNLIFCIIFVVEMLMKWTAYGLYKYFTDFWTVLDCIIVCVSVMSILIDENENLRVLRSLRTLRALRPLRAISRWQGMRIVVNALMYAIPSIFNVLLVCLVFWLIFSIMGVQFFAGKFFKCLDDEGRLVPIEKNYTWENSKITFDHVGAAYLALFQVATFEGWMEIMADAVDSRGVDLQPQREASLYAYIYFVIFIVCGSFFTLNLFIGVIIDNFNMLKKKYEGGMLEMFLTESQKHYYTAMKKLGRKKPQKVIKRPGLKLLAFFYDLSNSRRFEIAIFILIFLNMISMGIEHYDQNNYVSLILEVSNSVFTTIFSLEAIIKILGLRFYYFTVPWNVFDFLLVLASVFDILMGDVMIEFPISPTLLRVIRVFRIGRILRLIQAAKGIRKLLFALIVSLPALFNIGALLALITFIYAIIGMSLFGHVKQQGALNDMVNFETFGYSMQLLFRLMTSAGWNDVLESLMVQPPDCDPKFKNLVNGNCGLPLIAVSYFTSFILINYMIVINMYIAIILENFNQAHQEEEIGIIEDDLEMFYVIWSKFDPYATQFISFNQLSDFIAALDPPMGIAKPNTVALVNFNLPIAKGNKIHCLDILHALVKHCLGHVEETETFKQLQEQMADKFKKQFPTRKELEIVSSTRIWKREDKAARLIQNTFRNYLERKRADNEDKQTITSISPSGWQNKLTTFLHVHRNSRISSRKSSRVSEAGSDSSEINMPWINIPSLLLNNSSSKVNITVNDEPVSIAQVRTPSVRRKTFYNLFLRHQDAIDDDGCCSTSVSPLPSPQIARKLSTWLPLRRQSSTPVVNTEQPSENVTLLKRDRSLRNNRSDNQKHLPIPDISIFINK